MSDWFRELIAFLRDIRITGLRSCPYCGWKGREYLYFPHESMCRTCQHRPDEVTHDN